MGKRDEEEKGTLVEFPGDEIRMPTQSLPENLGRVDDDHPLRKPILVLIIILGIILAGVLIYAFAGGTFPSNVSGDDEVVQEYREAGNITYHDEIIDGWFIDSDRQHFMDVDGLRYTYVDPHEREGQIIAGYWRLIE